MTRFAPLAEPDPCRTGVLSADDALDRDSGGITATDAEDRNARLRFCASRACNNSVTINRGELWPRQG